MGRIQCYFGCAQHCQWKSGRTVYTTCSSLSPTRTLSTSTSSRSVRDLLFRMDAEARSTLPCTDTVLLLSRRDFQSVSQLQNVVDLGRAGREKMGTSFKVPINKVLDHSWICRPQSRICSFLVGFNRSSAGRLSLFTVMQYS